MSRFVLSSALCASALLCLSALLSVSASPLSLDTCPFPNGSETQLHFFECKTGTQIKVKAIKVKDHDGNPVYPLDPKKPMVLDLISHNNGVPITDNKSDVKIFAYQTGWASHQCQWNEIPTLGLLNNIDGCDYAHNCPLKSGDLTLELPLDLSSFANIVNLLAAHRPYQLEIHVKNFNGGNKAHEDIACIVAQIHLI